VSHELRTPLNSILGFADLLNDASCLRAVSARSATGRHGVFRDGPDAKENPRTAQSASLRSEHPPERPDTCWTPDQRPAGPGKRLRPPGWNPLRAAWSLSDLFEVAGDDPQEGR